MTNRDRKDNETVWGINELGEHVVSSGKVCVYSESEGDCLFVCELGEG